MPPRVAQREGGSVPRRYGLAPRHPHIVVELTGESEAALAIVPQCVACAPLLRTNVHTTYYLLPFER